MKENLEYKQQYLRNEIIDQGYNPDDFGEFMVKLSSDENPNLENWSFDELKYIVEKYKSTISEILEKENSKEIQNNDIKQEEEQNEEIKDIQNKENEFPNEALQDYEKIIQTVKLEDNPLTNTEELNITISNPVKINPGFFSSSYYQYTIETSPLGYKVVRKLSDFTFLEQVLPLFNSSVFIPSLPNFEYGLKDYAPKKMLLLQNYISYLMEDKFFRALPIIFEFLSLSQDDWNKKRIEIYNKMKPLPLEQIPTLEGEFHIIINKEKDKKGSEIIEEINKKNISFEALNSALDQIMESLDKISISFKYLAKAFSDLNKEYKNNSNLNDIFNRLHNLSKSWGRNYSSQKDFFDIEFKYYFNMMNNENNSFMKKCEEYKTIKDDYIYKFEKMKKIKDKNEKDLITFKNLRNDYGLELLMINNEYEKLIEKQGFRTKRQFNKYNEKKGILLQNLNNCIKLLDINEDISKIEEENKSNNLENKDSSESI